MQKMLFIAAVVFAIPAFADEDADFKKQVSEISTRYNEAYNNKNSDALAQVFASDAVFIPADGQVVRGTAEIKKRAEAEFGMGGHDLQAMVTEAHRNGNGGYAFGTFTVLYGDKNVKISGNWTAAYVIDGGLAKSRMLAASIPPPPPPKQ